MLKNFLLVTGILIALTGCKEKSFTISGKLVDAGQGITLNLDRLGASDLVPVDSVEVGNAGEFKFSGKLSQPEFFLLRSSNESFLLTLIEPGEKVYLEAYADSLTFPIVLKGSPGTQLTVAFDERLQEAIDGIQELNTEYQMNIDNPALDSIMEDLDKRASAIITDMNEYTKDYIDRNIGSLASLIALYKQIVPGVYVLNYQTDLNYFLKVDSALSSKYPESEPVMELHQQVGTLQASMGQPSSFSPGMVPPDISLPDPDGNIVSLSSTRGNIVLLDFWASWCAPCREENPNLVDAYSKYHDKGFEIFQVSLDQTREDWLGGIQEDHLGAWIHVSDLKYWNSEAAQLYNIESIPSNFLLDRDGSIIATGLRGQALQDALKELLD